MVNGDKIMSDWMAYYLGRKCCGGALKLHP